jgi:hypothetical protein
MRFRPRIRPGSATQEKVAASTADSTMPASEPSTMPRAAVCSEQNLREVIVVERDRPDRASRSLGAVGRPAGRGDRGFAEGR